MRLEGYQSTPLVRDWDFRLTKFLLKTISMVSCRTVPVSVRQPPKYTPISYTWGDADEKCNIEIEEHDVDGVQSTIYAS